MQILKASETGKRKTLTRTVKLGLETVHVETGLGSGSGLGPLGAGLYRPLLPQSSTGHTARSC